MSIVLFSSRRRTLLRLLKPPSLLRLFSAEPDLTSKLPGNKPGSDESLASQVVQHLLQIPPHDWASCETLDSLLFSSSSCSPRLILQITRRLESYSLALSFFDYLQEKSQSLQHHEESLSSVFQSIIEFAGHEPDSREKLLHLYEVVKQKKIPLTINAAKLLIRLFGRLEMVDQSVLVYEDLDPGMKNTHVRNVLIDVLLKDGRPNDAFKVLDEMLQGESDFPADQNTIDIVLDAAWRSNPRQRLASEEEIIGLVSRFGAHGVFPSCFWLTRFITNLCKNGRTDQAWNTLSELMNHKAPLEAPPFNALLTCLGRNMDIGRMNALSEKMKELDIQPDIVTFGILINTLCKSRRVDEALEFFEQMRGTGGGTGNVIKADVIHFNTLIDGFCKVGRVKEGEELLEKMRMEEGCAPNAVTYNSLITGYCRAGQLETAKSVVSRMKDEGIKPNVVTLNTIVGGMCRHYGVNMAVQFFMDMQREGLKGNVVTYTTFIKAYCNVNNIEKAMHWFNQMLEVGCSPDAMVYYTLISGLCQARREKDAMWVLEKLKEAGFSLDILGYNMLIGLLCDKKKVDEVYDMLSDMEERGVEPDSVTYNTLISFFSKNGDFDSAHRMLKKMREDRVVPTVVTYGTMIEACCSKGAMGEAMKLFKDMGSCSRVMPNTVIYNILINSLCKNKNVAEALSLKNDMKGKRVRPNVETYNALFKGLRDTNRLDKAYELMDEMVEHSCTPNYITVEILTEWLSAVGDLEKLKRFLRGYPVFTLSDKAAPLKALS